MMAKRTVIILVAALALALFGCGYSFVGAVKKMPEGISTVAIKSFTNATSEIGVERIFTEALIKEFSDRKSPPLVSVEEADGLIEGRITGLSVEEVFHSAVRVTSEARLTVTLSVTLKRKADGRVIWRDKNLVQREDYPVTGIPAGQQNNRRKAFSSASEKLAETIYLRIFSGF